mgnify:CR=1 FL=1
MLTFFLRRLVTLVPTLVFVSMLIFSLQQLLPGDPALVLAGEDPSPEAIAHIRAKLHLDDPLPVRYGYWVGGVLRGDLGESARTHQPVLELILQKLPVTIELAFLALFVSMWVFGTDDLFLMKSNYVVLIESQDVLWRYVGAFIFASFSLLTVTSLGFLMSSLANNSIGPIVGTMSAIVFFTILSTLNIPLFSVIKPYLFTTHMNNWKEFFDLQVNANNEAIRGSILNVAKIKNSLLVLGLHIILFVTIAIQIMKRKDILS